MKKGLKVIAYGLKRDSDMRSFKIELHALKALDERSIDITYESKGFVQKRTLDVSK